MSEEELGEIKAYECPFCFLCWQDEPPNTYEHPVCLEHEPRVCGVCEASAKVGAEVYIVSEELLLRRITVMEHAKMSRLPRVMMGLVSYMLDNFRHRDHEINDIWTEIGKGD
jgi:hypothetical protein